MRRGLIFEFLDDPLIFLRFAVSAQRVGNHARSREDRVIVRTVAIQYVEDESADSSFKLAQAGRRMKCAAASVDIEVVARLAARKRKCCSFMCDRQLPLGNFRW